jgi:hypothetical protein
MALLISAFDLTAWHFCMILLLPSIARFYLHFWGCVFHLRDSYDVSECCMQLGPERHHERKVVPMWIRHGQNRVDRPTIKTPQRRRAMYPVMAEEVWSRSPRRRAVQLDLHPWKLASIDRKCAKCTAIAHQLSLKYALNIVTISSDELTSS